MSQASPVIGANKSGLAYRLEDNDGKKALLNHHKGAGAPAYAEAGTVWLDDSATPWVLKMHDGADWIRLMDINATSNTVHPYTGAALARQPLYAADTGSVNSYAIAPVPALAAYAAGQIVVFKPQAANTGPSMINVNSLGLVPIRMPDSSLLPAGALTPSGVYILLHNGTHFLVLNPTQAVLASGLVDRAYASYSASGVINYVIPLDDSAPTSTEGAEIMSASLTPKNTTNRVRVTFTGFGYAVSANTGICTLVINSGPSAVQASCLSAQNSTCPGLVTFQYEHVPGTTSPVTYKIRAGGATTGALYLNSNGAGRIFGGVAHCSLSIEEFSA